MPCEQSQCILVQPKLMHTTAASEKVKPQLKVRWSQNTTRNL